MTLKTASTITSMMRVNGLTCELNMPPQWDASDLKNKGKLPPYNRRNAYPVNDYPACPSFWMHGNDKASSYFTPVRAGEGMWLDFNGCWDHSHHVAVLVSVQGINPISGLPTKNKPLRLEQYKKQCTIHKVDFQQDRFCPQCEYAWDAQNYITTTATPNNPKMLWIDGFRKPDGVVGQYIFTPEELQIGVAQQILKKKRVWAIGIAFYLSNDPKPVAAPPPPRIHPWPQQQYIDSLKTWRKFESSRYGHGSSSASASSNSTSTASRGSSMGVSTASVNEVQESMAAFSTAAAAIASPDLDGSMEAIEEITPETNIELSSGEDIEQLIHPDPEPVTFYRGQPEGMIYISYVTEADCQRIVAQGRRMTKRDGYLSGLSTAADVR